MMMQNSPELLFIGLAVALVCLFGIVSVLSAISKTVQLENGRKKPTKDSERNDV